MASDRVLINVFLLGVMDPYQGLDRLDHTLRVSNEVSIDIVGGQSGLELSQKPRQMDDLAMRSTHRTQAVIVGEEFREFWLYRGFVVSLMFHDLLRNDLVCLRNQYDCGRSLGIIQRIGDFPQSVEPGFHPFVILP